MFTEKIKLESDERILALVRKHWFLLALQMSGVVIGAFIPLIGYLIYTQLASSALSMFPLAIDGTIFVALYAAWLILSWMTLFNIWTNYYLDVWTVTNKRLVTVDQRGLFNRDTGSFRLERLQDINVSVRGLLATFLKYGDLHAETASEDQDFIARGIPDPQELKALILKAADDATFSDRARMTTNTAAQPTHINDGL